MENEIQPQSPATESQTSAQPVEPGSKQTLASSSEDAGQKKKKISIVNIIILVVLLIVLGIFISYYIQDESNLGQCQTQEDCGMYNVFYMKGQGYVCANDQTVAESSFKKQILMFKYASKKAIKDEPTGCLCTQNQCEVN